MNQPSPHPYADLSPDRILDAIDSLGLVPDGHLLALNSYENRVYRIGLEDAAPVVAKFYRPGRWSDAQIGEEHAFTVELAAHEIPTVPPLAIGGRTLHAFEGFRFALTPMRGGRAPELDDPETLEWLGRYLGRIHAVGATTRFVARPTLDIASFGEGPSTFLLDGQWLPPDLEATYRATVAQALEAVRACWAEAGAPTSIRLHGDCHRGNLLWTDAGPHFVDFDDARLGPAVQDLWMLLSGDRQEMSHQLGCVLAGYEAFHPFDYRELHLIEALRTLRLIHFSAWLARRWDDPAFPPAFPWFDTHHYWQGQILQLQQQVLAMQEGPLWRF
ncbi:serine/threonine protein kinase [Thiococcus pfennigii]|uniref:serine/threonine protein kinase n=1 Tax=Thiococcus pfennigii TaxID=1057 RepID=UPI001904DB75|nr:serine/threonine protein kinase [Thiococcus pfennigii]MBK1702224.1 stress response serine/threonine protein kinase YihE [Thiococcus pfennigii]